MASTVGMTYGKCNVRIVFNTSGILSENHYYPFGLPIHNLSTSTAPAGKENRYLYNGKELQDDLGLNWMDYGARFYDAGLGRWHSVDPLAEKYYPASPYAYTGNNPILFVDYDGRDYGVHFNHHDKTVTIKATYYAKTDDVKYAQNAVDSWNNQSGSFTYTIGKGENAVEYTVNFELSVVEVQTTDPDPVKELGQLNAALAKDKSGEGNIFTVVKDKDMDGNNGTATNNYIRVAESRKETETGMHEIGHTLGMGHSVYGVLTSQSSDPNRSKDPTVSNVHESISSARKGKQTIVTNADNSTAPAGKGTVKNSTPYTGVTSDVSGPQRSAQSPANIKGKVRRR